MKRIVARIAVGTVAVVGVLVGLTWWARPDLLASLSRLPIPAAFQGSPEVEAPVPEAPQEEAELIDDGWCSTHQLPEAQCPQCRDLPSVGTRECQRLLPVIRLSGPDVARRIGLETATIEARMHADTIVGNAAIAYNEHAYAEVRPRVAGLVAETRIDHGDPVTKGQLLVVIDSADVGTAKAEYLAALPVIELAESTLERTQALTRSNALPMKDELQALAARNTARADLLNASQRLRNLGFTDSELAQIAKAQDTSSQLRILSPIEGTVIERHAVPGEAVQPTDPLVVVADVRSVWAWIDVYENEIERVHPGQEVTFRIGGVADREFPGVVEYIDTAVNPATRTIRVRAELQNPEGRLRANQFGQAALRVGEPHRALFVPGSALQVVDDGHLVFLAQDDGSYRPQHVLLEEGENLRGEAEVLWGLEEGQRIVTTGSFLLKSELRKDELAGE